MSIKAGQFLHDAEGFVIDRIQTGGVGNINIPEEKVYELGNFQTVATVRDIPDLSFDLESQDVSPEIEAILTGADPLTTTNGQKFDFATAHPIDVVSPFKSALGAFDIVKSIAVPYLTLENVTYRFGTRSNATQSYSFRGDSVYYTPGTAKYVKVANTTGGSFGNTAIAYTEAGQTVYALCVTCYNPTTGRALRLFHGTDYTDTTTTWTISTTQDLTPFTHTQVVYATNAATNYPQTVHQGVSVKPAAVRGKDIDVYIGSAAATTLLTRWTGVQSFEVTRRVNIENDEEFGNAHYVESGYDVPEVSGNVVVKPNNPTDLWTKIAQVANVSTSVVAGPLSSTSLACSLKVRDPDTGSVLKTLFIPDARFTIPGTQGRVQQKVEVTFNFTSDTGTLEVYKGDH